MPYVDYKYYTDTYCAGRTAVITEQADFTFNQRLAEQYILQHTYNNIVEVSTEVKNCCCEITELFAKEDAENSASSGTTSQKVGECSTAFESSKDREEKFARKRFVALRRWLGLSGLLYSGYKGV